MSSSCILKVFSGLCTCFISLCSNFIIIIGGLLAAIGVLITFGVQWLLNIEAVSKFLPQVQQLLQGLGIDVDLISVLRNLSSVTGSLGASLIAIGLFLVVLSCIGCFSSCCKCCRPLLIVYAIGVGVLFVAQLSLVIIWFGNRDIIFSAIQSAMENLVRQYRGTFDMNIETLLLDLLQITLSCCGVQNGTDFHTTSENWNRSFTIAQSNHEFTFNLTYPVSCCNFNDFQLENEYCPYNNTRSNFDNGCYHAFRVLNSGLHYQDYAFYGLAGLLGIEVLLIIGAIIVYLNGRQGGRRSDKVGAE